MCYLDKNIDFEPFVPDFIIYIFYIFSYVTESSVKVQIWALSL